MHVARSLLLHGAHHGRIAVTDIADRNPGHEVEITLAFGRIEKRAFGARDLHQHRRRGGLGDMRQKLFAENHTILSICADSGQERRTAYKSGTIPRRCKIASESFTLRRIQRQSVSACSASDIRQLPTVRRMRSESV